MEKGLGAVSLIAFLLIPLTLPGSAHGDCTGLAPANECASGGGSKTADCQMEWRFTPMPKRYANATPTPDVLRGRQRSRIICYEGDPRCDFDANLANNSCTFRTEIFINNEDPNLPNCSPAGGLTSFEMKSPKPGSSNLTPSESQTITTFENQANAGFGLTVVRSGEIITLGPGNNTLNLGSPPLNVVVPMRQTSGGGYSTGKRRVRIQSRNLLSRSDTDSLLLLCRPSTCGNGAIEGDHETCDDGNRNNLDGCNQGCQVEGPAGPTPTRTPTRTPTVTATITETPTITGTPTDTPTAGAGPPTAFRATTLTIADPHVWADPFGSGLCLDVTNTVNGLLAGPMNSDGDDPPDGLLDLSILVVFRPLNQAGAGGTAEAYIDADCTAPVAGTSCTPGGATVQLVDYTNQAAGTCLTSVAGTTGGYSPAVNSSTAPCFVTDQIDVTFDFSGIAIDLQDGRVAARYIGTPATALDQGLLYGFLSEATADMVILPSDLPAPFGGATLSSLLAGGTGNCKTAMPRGTCTAGCRDDRDLTQTGWYFYLNFTGTNVTYSD
jgi:cysteine-rich repeat protein